MASDALPSARAMGQEQLNPGPSAHATGRERPDPGRFAAGGIAGCVAKTTVAPLERVRIAAQAIVFGCNDYYTRLLAALPGDVVPVGAAAGGLAGLTAVAITYPLDVLRTMLSATSADGGQRGASEAISHTLRTRGVAAFYVGVRPTMVGGTFHEAARFGIFDATRRAVGADVWWANFACGAAAGVAAGVLLYPNDTVRRQLQMGRYDTYVGAARGLVAAGGVRRLYAGLAPYLFRAGPGAAIQFATFGELKKLLDSS
ncbi:ATP:ADP antiporter [Aureococcus anophagefferens]|nr:ATP:ADP antiporter [Aureococcus anophagefferens]